MDKQLKAQEVANKLYNGIRKKCLCGCGQETNYNAVKKDLNDYMKGHLARTNANPTKGTKGTLEAKEHMRKAYEKRKSDLQTGEAIQWNKGLTAETDDRVKQYSEKQIGKVVSDELKDNQSKRMHDRIAKMKEDGTYDTEFNAWQKEYWKDPQHRLEQSKRSSENVLNMKFKTSKFELDVIDFLQANNIIFKHEFRISTKEYNKVYDFKIDENILLECDGDFWHCNPIKFPNGPTYKMQHHHINNDIIKNELAKKYNYKLIRIWHSDFYKNKELLLEKIKGVQ